MCLSRRPRGRLGRRRRPSRDARRRLGAGARVTRRSRAAARGGGAERGSRTREARYLRRCCESNCPLKDLRAALQRVRAGRRGSSSSAWVRSVAALWPWSTAPRYTASSAAAPDRSALCDFFDSQRGLAPPGRVRGPHAARDGSGALGGRVLAGSHFLGTPDTHCSAGGARGRHIPKH